MRSTVQASVKLFCSYSHKDERYLNQLKTCLTGLRRQGLIEEWHDRKIIPGQEWEEAIEENLKTSQIILLLVTPDFMSSDFSYEKEMKQALDRHERDEARVIPIIVRPSDWEWAPFGKLQALPKNAKAITRWTDKDEAWLDVARGIRKAVEELTTRPIEHEQEADELADRTDQTSSEDFAEGTEHPLLSQYRAYVQSAWADGELSGREAEWLRKLANNELELSLSTAAEIEREVMGDTIEGILARQQRAAKEEDRSAAAQAWMSGKPDEAEAERLGLDPRSSGDDFADYRKHVDSRSASSAWEYLDLELEIREGDHRKYPVVVRSARGQEAREEMHFPFDEKELEDKLEDLERAVLLSGTKRRRTRTPERQIVQDFGQTLFQALLCGEVGAYYEESLHKARLQNKGLRLKLRIQPPELLTLPWEFLYDPNRDAYLSLSCKTPLVRYVDLHEPVEQLTVTPPLRILGMVASPRDLPRLEVEKEKQRVEEAIGDLQAKGRVELTWLEGQTSRDLMRAMRRGPPWHVFHFIGHGDFDAEAEEGLIALADEEGNKRFLQAEDLAYLLKDHWDLRLVLLNSCGGARGSEHDAFSSTAATLVRPGIPAVLAMQYEISDAAAVEFSRAFYEAVADGLPLDAAVAGARTSLKIELGDTLEWGTPVLYMRSVNGRIFDVQQQEDPRSQYRERVESVWVDGELRERQVEWLGDYANNKLELSPSTAAEIEREVMGDPKEAVLERQTKDREEQERRNRLDELHKRARWTHQTEEWQAVIDLVEQIRAEDPSYPDLEGLLASAREALTLTRRVAAMHDRGLQHIEAEEWTQALECFEEVQLLKPDYRGTEQLLSRVRQELAKPPTVEVPDLAGQSASQASSTLDSRGLKLGAQNKAPSETIPEGEIIRQHPEVGKEVEASTSVSVTVSSGPSAVEAPDLTAESRLEARSMPAAAGPELGDQTETPNDNVPEDRIVEQRSAPGTKAKQGSSVSNTLSSGPEEDTTIIPDASSENLEEAEQILSSTGLVPEGLRAQKSSGPAGMVISTDPSVGSEVDALTSATPIVSSGPRTSPAKPTFLPGKQKSKPDFLPGKQKSKPDLPLRQQKPKPDRPRSLPGGNDTLKPKGA